MGYWNWKGNPLTWLSQEHFHHALLGWWKQNRDCPLLDAQLKTQKRNFEVLFTASPMGNWSSCFPVCIKVHCLSLSSHLVSLQVVVTKRRPTDPISDSGSVQGYRSCCGVRGRGGEQGKASVFVNCLVLMHNFVMHHFREGWWGYPWRLDFACV